MVGSCGLGDETKHELSGESARVLLLACNHLEFGVLQTAKTLDSNVRAGLDTAMLSSLGSHVCMRLDTAMFSLFDELVSSDWITTGDACEALQGDTLLTGTLQSMKIDDPCAPLYGDTFLPLSTDEGCALLQGDTLLPTRTGAACALLQGDTLQPISTEDACAP